MLITGSRLSHFIRTKLKWNLLLLYGIFIVYTAVLLQSALQTLGHWRNAVSQLNHTLDFRCSLQKKEELSLEICNLSHAAKENFRCVRTRTVPSTTVCLYSQWTDVYISHDLEDTGRWEPHVADDFLEVLRRDEDLGVFDLGANIGYYTLLAAKAGHRVVAVEPLVENAKRIRKAAQVEGLTDRITLLRNAVADMRSSGTVRASGDNQGDTRVEMGVKPCQGSCPLTVKTILLDDLVSVSNFTRAVMKMDIQGYEHRAFLCASILFGRVKLTYIFMEWLVMKEFYLSDKHQSDDKYLVETFLSFMFRQNYRPRCLEADGGRPLDRSVWHLWPDDIVWYLLPDPDMKSKLLQSHFAVWPA